MLVSVVVEAHGTGRMRALAEFRSDRRVSGRVGRTSTLDFARCASSRANISARIDPPGSVSPATVIASARPPVCAGKIHQRTPTFRLSHKHDKLRRTICPGRSFRERQRLARRRGRSPVDLRFDPGTPPRTPRWRGVCRNSFPRTGPRRKKPEDPSKASPSSAAPARTASRHRAPSASNRSWITTSSRSTTRRNTRKKPCPRRNNARELGRP